MIEFASQFHLDSDSEFGRKMASNRLLAAPANVNCHHDPWPTAPKIFTIIRPTFRSSFNLEHRQLGAIYS